jgi:hypothetical protein
MATPDLQIIEEDSLADGSNDRISPDEQFAYLQEMLAQRAKLEQEQRKAQITAMGGDFDTNVEKYQERLSPYMYQAPKMGIFDLASELGAGLLSTPNTGGASAYTGLGVGFTRFSDKLKQQETDNAKARQQLGLQAAQLAMQDEQKAEDFLNQIALKTIDNANKDQSYIRIEYDEVQEDGTVVTKDKTLANILSNRDEINDLFAKGGREVKTAETQINMPDPNAGYGERGAIDAIRKSSDAYQAESHASQATIDQVNAAYLLAVQAKEAGGELGPFSAATLRMKETIIGLGFGDLLDAPDSVAPLKALNQLSMNFVMGIVSQTKGAISEREMDLFINASPTLGSTYDGLMTQLQLLEKLARRKKQFFKDYINKTIELEDAGIPGGSKQEKLLDLFAEEWSDKNPLLTAKEEETLQYAIDNPNIGTGFVPETYRALIEKTKKEKGRKLGSLPVVRSQADFDALESGDEFIEDGEVYTKP